MTVREAVKVLKTAQEIRIGWDGVTYEIDPDNAFTMDAYGKYVVDSIHSFGKDVYEIMIAAIPVKEA